MKFLAAVTALIFSGLAAITLAPKLAFSQVLPLEDVMQTHVFGHHFKGPIRHLTEAMLPSKDGRAGYAPKHIVVEPGAYASASPSDSSMKYYIDIQTESGFDCITYAGDEAKQFFAILSGGGELRDDIAYIVMIDPADADYTSDVIYLGGYDKDGKYVGSGPAKRADVEKAVAEKPAV